MAGDPKCGVPVGGSNSHICTKSLHTVSKAFLFENVPNDELDRVLLNHVHQNKQKGNIVS